MKRTKNLFQKISEIDNLYLAFYKAKKGKSQSSEMQDFQKNLEGNLQQMAHDIQHECFELGNYTYFMIKDPKERKICAASFRERVLHHAIMNIFHDSFEKNQIIDLQGRVIVSDNLSGNSHQIKLHSLPQAVYILEIITDKGKQKVKIVKK